MKVNFSTDTDSKGIDMIANEYLAIFIEDEGRNIEIFIDLEKHENEIQITLSDPIANNFVNPEWLPLNWIRANLENDFISRDELGLEE